MSKLDWSNNGRRSFETGVDRGVLYTTSGIGVAWNGLVSITESPSGGKAESYYLDGQKYLNQSDSEEFEGTIEAFTYPKEFAEHDGTASVKGLYIHEQFRKPFGLSYRTLIGSGLSDYDFKIHLVYNAVALPSDSEYLTQGDDTEALTFSWDFTTSPVNVIESLGNKPLSHISITSSKTLTSLINRLGDILYGTEASNPRLPELNEVFELFDLYSKTGYGQGPYGKVPYGGNTRLGV